MPELGVLLRFAIASFVLAVTPGPSIVLLLAVGTERGRGAAAATAFGLAIGTFTWVLVVTAGIGAMFAARPDVLRAVAVVGGAYLLWLAVRAMRTPALVAPGTAGADGPGRSPTRSPLLDGVVVNLLNPSLTLFLAAIVPPFVVTERAPVWQQVLVLGAVLTTVSTVVNLGWGAAGAVAGARLRAAVGERPARLVATASYTAIGLLAIATALV